MTDVDCPIVVVVEPGVVVVTEAQPTTIVVEQPVSTIIVNPPEATTVVLDQPPAVIVTSERCAGNSNQLNVTVTPTILLSGHRVVTPTDDGTQVEYADNTDVDIVTRPLWLTYGSMTANIPGVALAEGPIEEPSWTWTPSEPIFLGASGALTQTLPTAPSFLVQVASAMTATRIYYQPRHLVVQV